MCTMCQTLDPSLTSYDSHGLTNTGGGSVDAAFSQGSTSTGTDAAGLPVYSLGQIADYLTHGYWAESGRSERSFDVKSGGTITVNLTGLNAYGQETARKALDAWTAVTGLNFVDAASADITFDDNNAGAYAGSATSGTTILYSQVNVDAGWSAYGDYYLQTYIHEIGHALGLGHGGNYNGRANYGTDAHYANDSWQTTVMSYFDQNENTYSDASRVFLATAQVADILAIQNLYGKPVNVQTGDTTYGDRHSTGQFGMDLSGNYGVSIYDSAGTDTINLTSRLANQRLDLRAESFSDINGKKGNLSIGSGTVIENARTGGGADQITGNAADNTIDSGAGNDIINADAGNDVLIGGAGNDTLTGGTGADRFVYRALSDAGDTITDISVSAGDRIDLRALLQAIGYTGQNPVADGILSLETASGGANLLVIHGGVVTRLAFLEGLDPATSVATLTDTTGTPTPDPEPELDPDPQPVGSTDTTYTISASTVSVWSRYGATLADTDGGTDTLDLSSFDTTLRVYLDPGQVGRIGGKKLAIAAGTVIENVVLGSANDRAYGNDVGNLMNGMAGNDFLYGMAGDDQLLGGDGNDRLVAGMGDDTAWGEAGNDLLEGEEGNDYLDGGDGRDRVYGDGGDDVLVGGAGNDLLRGDAGNDSLDGGIGDDRFYGGDGGDLIIGGDGSDRAYGGNDNDSIVGGAGRDFLRGENGADLISGDADDDRLEGGAGSDTLLGGEGNDRIKGDNDADVIDGGSGDDRLWGGSGNDLMSGGDDDDRLWGGNQNDLIEGGAGDDRLFGDAHEDTLSGGTGADILKGGTGADVFVFASLADAGDKILDFSLRQGDRIEVSTALESIGLTVADAIALDVLQLNGTTRAAWLEIDIDGAGAAAPVQMAFIRGLSAETQLTEDWLI